MVGHEPTYFNERQINIKIQGKRRKRHEEGQRERERRDKRATANVRKRTRSNRTVLVQCTLKIIYDNKHGKEEEFLLDEI